MENRDYDFRAALRVVRTLYAGMIVGQLLFLIVASVIVEEAASTAFDISEPLNLGLVIVTLSAIPVGGIISRRVLGESSPDHSLRAKMAKYQTGLIIRMATYEAVSLFAIVVFIVTSNLTVLLFTLIALVGQVMVYPTRRSISNSVDIKESEMDS